MFTVTVTAKFSMHAKMKAYRYTFLRPNVWENIRQFLSSTKKMHTKENWFIYSASRCTTALLRAVSGQRVAPDHRVADGGGGQQAESRRDGSFADAVEVNLRGWEGNRRSGGSVISTVALLRAVSGQRVASDLRVPDWGGGQQAESRRNGVVRLRRRGESSRLGR